MSDFREEEKLGKLYDTQITRRLMKYLWPYRWQVVVAVSMTLGRRGHGHPRALPFPHRGGPLHRAWRGAFHLEKRCDDRRRLARPGIPGLAPREFRPAIRAGANHAIGRPEDDVRLAQGNLRTSSAPAHEFLRPQPGRPTGDPRDHRRGRTERPFCLGCRCHAERFCAAIWPGGFPAVRGIRFSPWPRFPRFLS